MCGALWEISVHDNGDEETGVQIDLPLSNTISQIRLQRPFIFQQLPQILWKAKNALLPFSFLAFLHFVLPEGGLNTTTNLNVDMSRYKKFFNKIIILLSLIKQDLVWPWSSKGGVAWPGAFKILAVLTYPPPPFLGIVQNKHSFSGTLPFEGLIWVNLEYPNVLAIGDIYLNLLWDKSWGLDYQIGHFNVSVKVGKVSLSII